MLSIIKKWASQSNENEEKNKIDKSVLKYSTITVEKIERFILAKKLITLDKLLSLLLPVFWH